MATTSSYTPVKKTIPPSPCATCCTGGGGGGGKPHNANSSLSVPVGMQSAGVTNTGGANSVLLSSGQFMFTLGLLSTAGIGGGAWSFGLNYLAGSGVVDLLGPGFAYTQLNNLTLNSDNSVDLYTGDNLAAHFIPNGIGSNVTYSSATGNNSAATLLRTGIGTAADMFTLTNADGAVATFAGFSAGVLQPGGRMLSYTDRYGSGQTYAWSSVGGAALLDSVTDCYGRTINYSYTVTGGGYRLSQITDFLGRQLDFQYDSGGRLTAAVLPSINNAAPGNTFPNGTAYVFQWDSNNPRPERQNDLIKIFYPNQVAPFLGAPRTVDVNSVYAQAQSRYAITYGQDPTDADQWGRALTETVGVGGTGPGGTFSFLYTSDPADLPANIIDPNDPIVFRTVVTDRNGNQSIYDFNANGVASHVGQLASRQKNSQEATEWDTWTQYTANNLELLVVKPAGNSIAFTRDSGMVQINGASNPAVLLPQRRGLLLTTTELPGNSIGIPERTTPSDQAQLQTSYFYDPIYSQQCAMIEPRGNPIGTAGGANVYFTPQNGGTPPTDADRSRYATTNFFDYQKNQLSTIINSPLLQQLLGFSPT